MVLAVFFFENQGRCRVVRFCMQALKLQTFSVVGFFSREILVFFPSRLLVQLPSMSGKGETSSLIHGAAEVHEEREWGTKKGLTYATYLLIGFQIFLLFLFGTTTGSELVTYGTGTQAYNFFIGVEIMM